MLTLYKLVTFLALYLTFLFITYKTNDGSPIEEAQRVWVLLAAGFVTMFIYY